MKEIKLRDYQQKAVDEIEEDFKKYQAVLFVLATAGGKTFTFSYIAREYAKNNKTVMIVAHRSELISQASLSLAKIGVRHKIISPDATVRKIRMLHFTEIGESLIDPFSNVSIGSVQTIGVRLDKLDRPDLLITDEAHHAPAGQWKKASDYFNTRHLGVTATPIRSDGIGLGAVYSSMVIGKGMAELLADGDLCQYRVYSTPEDINMGDVKRIQSGESKGDYNRKDIEQQMDKPKIVGRAVEHYKKYAEGKAAIVFAVSVAHSHHIAEEFQRAGYNFIAVSAKTDDKERFKAVYDLKVGNIQGIVNCDLFGEGTDIPVVEVAIMMRPISELAFSLFSQQVGRALRNSEGKEEAIILDMVGNFARHGFPEDKTDWTLDDREKKKRGRNNDEDTIKVKTCPECFTTHKPAASCPDCGYQYPVDSREYEQVDGDLVELERARELANRKQEQNAGIRNAQTKADLLALDAKLGLKRGASAHKQRAIKEKKEAMVRLNKAIGYYKQNVAWGCPKTFDKIMNDCFGVTEKEARKYGAVRANRLCDSMRDLLELRNSLTEEPYSSLNYKLAMFKDSVGF
jgi:superfamily II DNA or RNA helicase